MSYSIVIPSRNLDNLTKCVGRLREMGETARIIVVDDFDPCPTREMCISAGLDLSRDIVATGADPFCFARNCNIGIRAAGSDDVILLNDDCLLETSNGFAPLARFGAGSFGIVSASIKGPAHPVHRVRKAFTSPGVCVVDGMVPFVCVYLSRRMLDNIGLLDERFVPGGYEDNDLCDRAVIADWLIGVSNLCVVDHQTLPHTFRPAGQPDLYDLPTQARRYAAKRKGQ